MLATLRQRAVPALRRSMVSQSLRGVAAAQRSVHTHVEGEEGTESWRMFYGPDAAARISPWHDVELSTAPGTFNFINEIPKMTKKKMEISTKEAGNPIAQDIKKGNLREYHGPIFWNYGCLPQTWEDPSVKHPELGYLGDGDPIDAVEIGSAPLECGAVAAVRRLPPPPLPHSFLSI
jgi:inorganic pyrophosphatase